MEDKTKNESLEHVRLFLGGNVQDPGQDLA